MKDNYPWYTPYQFAGNSPIANIDLDGLEQLNVTIESHPGGGKPGKAKIDIISDYYVIKAGPGAVTFSTQGQISPTTIAQIFNKGDGGYQFGSLPTAFAEGKLACQEQIESMSYYDVYIDYKITIETSLNGQKPTIATVKDLRDNNRSVSRGVYQGRIFEDKMDNAGIGWIQYPLSSEKDILEELNTGGPNGAGDVSPSGNVNIVWLNPNWFKGQNGVKVWNTTQELIPGSGAYVQVNASPNEVIVHSVGHNSAADHRHNLKTKAYEYNQVGLQSNMYGKVYPTSQNTLNIVNDPMNRSCISTKDNTCQE